MNYILVFWILWIFASVGGLQEDTLENAEGQTHIDNSNFFNNENIANIVPTSLKDKIKNIPGVKKFFKKDKNSTDESDKTSTNAPHKRSNEQEDLPCSRQNYKNPKHLENIKVIHSSKSDETIEPHTENTVWHFYVKKTEVTKEKNSHVPMGFNNLHSESHSLNGEKSQAVKNKLQATYKNNEESNEALGAKNVKESFDQEINEWLVKEMFNMKLQESTTQEPQGHHYNDSTSNLIKEKTILTLKNQHPENNFKSASNLSDYRSKENNILEDKWKQSWSGYDPTNIFKDLAKERVEQELGNLREGEPRLIHKPLPDEEELENYRTKIVMKAKQHQLNG